MHQESERLTRLINDLLDISKIEADRSKLSLGKFDLNNFFKDYRKQADSLVIIKNISLEINTPKKVSIIMADKDKIKQIFDNLIGNAVKFSPEKSNIVINVRELKQYFEIDVMDEGIGIAKKDVDGIFTKFYRAENKLKSRTRGSGLGLAICKHLVESHGGNIWVDSSVKKGSIFSFTLSKNLNK